MFQNSDYPYLVGCWNLLLAFFAATLNFDREGRQVANNKEYDEEFHQLIFNSTRNIVNAGVVSITGCLLVYVYFVEREPVLWVFSIIVSLVGFILAVYALWPGWCYCAKRDPILFKVITAKTDKWNWIQCVRRFALRTKKSIKIKFGDFYFVFVLPAVLVVSVFLGVSKGVQLISKGEEGQLNTVNACEHQADFQQATFNTGKGNITKESGKQIP